jgi:DNA-directed RNA polymerase specialized sigma24 family protein
MRYFEGLSYQEMSGILATTEGALKASYHWAVKKIEASLRADPTVREILPSLAHDGPAAQIS